ncbi:surface protease GP63, partial [Trypanosoma theileri]
MFPRLGMMGTFFGVRGREFVWMINVSKAKEVARKYFNCPTAEGLEMESTGWGSASHFSIRVAKGDMMGPGYSPLVYSELSLAVFDSMPFYKANFDKAEPLVWGKNAGCDFLEKKCLENGVSPNPEIFCNRSRSSDMYFCTPDRMGLGYCTLKTYYRALPEPFQYFKDKRMGGDLRALDYCPYVEAYSDTTCTSGFHLQSRGSFIGENARCVKGVELEISGKSVGDVCVNTKCDNGILSVQFLGDDDDEWHVCEEKKEIIPNKENWSGKIICPRYDAVCTKLPDITIPLKELPYQDGDYKPAPGNITWNKTETPSSDPLPHPAPEPTMETVGAPHVEKEPSSSYPNVPTDSSGSTDTTTPVQRDVFEKERIDSPTSTAHSETMLDQNEKHHDGLDGSQHGS